MNIFKKLYCEVFNLPTLDIDELISDCHYVIVNAKSVYDLSITSPAEGNIHTKDQVDGMIKTLRNMETNLFNKYRNLAISQRDVDDFQLVWFTSLVEYIDYAKYEKYRELAGPMSVRVVKVLETIKKEIINL